LNIIGQHQVGEKIGTLPRREHPFPPDEDQRAVMSAGTIGREPGMR